MVPPTKKTARTFCTSGNANDDMLRRSDNIMKNRTRILSAAVLMTACIATLAQRDQNVRPAKPGEVPFVYNASDSVEIESVPKSLAQPDETPTESPAHSCFHLKDKRPLPVLAEGSRYFYPAHSRVCIIPLTDTIRRRIAVIEKRGLRMADRRRFVPLSHGYSRRIWN